MVPRTADPPPSSRALLRARAALEVWLPVALVGTVHYATPPGTPWVHDVLRRAFYVPLIFAGARGGVAGGLLAAAVVVGVYAPHAFFIEGASDPGRGSEKLLEIAFYIVIGVLSGVIGQREHRLRAAQRALFDRLRRSLEEGRRKDAMLERAARLESLGQLTAGLAHEIRNPLHAMRGTAEILLDAVPEGDPARRVGASLISEIDRLGALLDRFLGFARPPDRAERDVEPARVVERVHELLRARAAEQGTRVRVVGRAAPTVRGDEDQLVQIVLGIALNGLQALGRGGEVRLAARAAERDGRAWARIDVENDGPPLPADIRAGLFDPFVSGRPDGTGLGLAIAWRIATSHGGFIEAEDLDGGGVAFRVWLPAAPA